MLCLLGVLRPVGMRGDRQNFNLRGDRIETCGSEGRSPEFRLKGRSH